MSETKYFWQGGRKIEIQKDDAAVTIQADSEAESVSAAARAGVQVNITHTYIGDLRVDLIAPDGTAVVLHNNTGGSADDLVQIYSVQNTPALRPFLNRPIRGRWQLRVRDTFRLDVGRLNRWRLAARVR